MLIGLAVDRFHLNECDAQTLAHEVFLAYFLKAEDVRDVRAWLVGAICNAGRQFLRKIARDVALPDDIANMPDPRQRPEMLPDQIAAREMFACCTARCHAYSAAERSFESAEQCAAKPGVKPRKFG